MKKLRAVVVVFGILASGLSHAASVCSLSRIQSQDYACRFTYDLVKINSETGAAVRLADFTYENDLEKNVGCDNGGVENAKSKRQLKNAEQAAADLKAAGICDVIITEF